MRKGTSLKQYGKQESRNSKMGMADSIAHLKQESSGNMLDDSSGAESLLENKVKGLKLQDSPKIVDDAEKIGSLQLKPASRRKNATLVPKRKTLVLDLDETLIHSSFEPMGEYSFTLPLMQDGVEKTIYIGKRPFVDEFLEQVSKMFDIVIFTAGLKSYADPVINALDINNVCKKRYFRDSCIFWNGYYIKDLEILNKPLKDVIIIDNSPTCYCLNPNNAIPIESWFNDQSDFELYNLLPLLTNLSQVEDVTDVLTSLYTEDSPVPDHIIQKIKQAAH